eukprot:scaffold65505_cov14-Tisochrysis_lutea.AAC.2
MSDTTTSALILVSSDVCLFLSAPRGSCSRAKDCPQFKLARKPQKSWNLLRPNVDQSCCTWNAFLSGMIQTLWPIYEVEALAGDVREALCRVSDLPFDETASANVPTVAYEATICNLLELAPCSLLKLLYGSMGCCLGRGQPESVLCNDVHKPESVAFGQISRFLSSLGAMMP